MSLPAIAPYPMPTGDDVTGNRLPWRVEPDRAVLLIHDMQNYFVRAFTPGTAPVVDLVASIAALRSQARASGIPVVYSAQPADQSPDDRGLLADLWGPGMSGRDGEPDIVDALAPGPGDTVLTKWRYSAFARTDLSRVLEAAGRDQLIVCGVYAHIGCLMTACDAFMRDVQAFLVADAVADFSVEYHRQALQYAAQRCAVIVTTESLVQQIPAAGSRGVRAR